MDILQYISNPLGKGSSIINNTEIKNSLNNQFELIKDRIKFIWYAKSDNILICHVGIPSTSLTELKYDVILEFNLTSISSSDTSINNAIMKVFSNCPSFVFTYAYAFNKQNGLCDWLKGKYNKKILLNEPKERNRYNIISYEKSLYLACKFIMSNSNNKLTNIRARAIPINNFVQVSNLIATDEQILERYKNLKVKLKEENDKKKSNESSSPTKASSDAKHATKTSNTTKKTKTTATTKVTKKTKKI